MTFAGAAIGNAATLETGPMMSVPRMGHYVVPMPGGAVALLGGHGTGFVALNSMDLWTPTNNSFTGASIPFVYDGGALVPLSDGTYLMAGGAANLGIAPGYASAQILYPSNATVTSTGTSMVYPRMRCQGAQLTGGNVLIVGGWYDAASTTYGEIFSPSNNAFASTGPLNNPRSLPLVFPTSDGQAVVVGGTSIYGDSDISSVELYNPSSNTFTVLAPFVIPSETAWVYAALGYSQDIEHCKTSDGRYVFMMSQNGGTDYALAFFDPASKQFSKLALTPAFWTNVSVWQPVVDPTNNRALMLAGANLNGGANATFQVYQADLATGQTLALSDPLTISNYYPGSVAMTLLQDGRLFVTGGSSSMGYDYNFDPVQNTFFLNGIYPPPQLQQPAVSGGTCSFYIQGTIGGTYQIQSISILGAGLWQMAGSVTLTNSIQRWSDPAVLTNSTRFYQLVQTSP